MSTRASHAKTEWAREINCLVLSSPKKQWAGFITFGEMKKFCEVTVCHFGFLREVAKLLFWKCMCLLYHWAIWTGNCSLKPTMKCNYNFQIHIAKFAIWRQQGRDRDRPWLEITFWRAQLNSKEEPKKTYSEIEMRFFFPNKIHGANHFWQFYDLNKVWLRHMDANFSLKSKAYQLYEKFTLFFPARSTEGVFVFCP